MQNQLDTLRLLRDSLIEGLGVGRDVVRVGGFVVLFHPSDHLLWMNQSMPVGDVVGGDVVELLRVYSERDRSPWLEFSPELWPEGPAVLEAHGLTCQHTMPVMVMYREEWTHRDTSARPVLKDEVGAMVETASLVFEGVKASPESVSRTQKQVEKGNVLASVVQVGDEIISCGQAIGTSSVREIAGLATLEEHRRRGHCSAVVWELLGRHFGADGSLAWLTPGDETARRLYAGLGFRPIGTQVTYGLP
jgi:hypothetical protein